jgi:hypothetical protein
MRGGGAERVQLAIMRHLVAAGHEVDLILAHEGGILLSLLPPEVRVFELRARRLAAAFPGLVRFSGPSSRGRFRRSCGHVR